MKMTELFALKVYLFTVIQYNDHCFHGLSRHDDTLMRVTAI